MKIFSYISDRFNNTSRVIILICIISLSFLPNVKADTYRGITFQVFYDELMPYGDWINDPQHGFVWIPYVEQNFHPYGSRGNWVMTSYGNTWVSDYDWGWAPFHYGRWFFTNHYGWAWVPGYEWGPAWVDWRTGGGYYGWAPLAPVFQVNYAVALPYHHYVFVPHRRLTHRNINRYYVPRNQVINVYNHTTIINNTYVHNSRTYIAGPDRREVERYSRKRVPVYQVNNAPRAGRAAVNNRSVALYRPEVSRNAGTQARPSRVVSSTDYNRGTQKVSEPRNTRNANIQQTNAQRNNAQEVRRNQQSTNQNRIQNAPAIYESTAVRNPTTNRSNEAVRSAAPSRAGNGVNPDTRTITPIRTENRNINTRENMAPQNAGSSTRTAATSRQRSNPTPERVNQRPQQTQTRQANPRQQQVGTPTQQRQQQVAVPSQGRTSRPNNVQQSAPRTSAPTSVTPSRNTGRSSGNQSQEQVSNRSNSRSPRGNN